ncbi:MAG TPA: DinB family protein [Cyclobacteriaceae bacterium]|nr:DinB family protein [Cyclobacteriaceae bacterium]
MKSLFKEIFEYHHHFNQKLIGEIKTHLSALPERTFPLFCHVLNAHQIWNARILGLEQFSSSVIVHPIEACSSLDDDNYHNTLKILDSEVLLKEISYKTFKGDEFKNIVRDILFHVNNHSTHHKGQIISDFRQSGIAPLVTDYIFYKR